MSWANTAVFTPDSGCDLASQYLQTPRGGRGGGEITLLGLHILNPWFILLLSLPREQWEDTAFSAAKLASCLLPSPPSSALPLLMWHGVFLVEDVKLSK